MRPAPLPGRQTRHDLLACTGITFIWTALACVVGVHGDFPLNDDFAYTRAIQLSLEHGRIMRIDWTWIPLVTHTVIGLAFSAVLGFSFATLRISTLFMGWLGLIATYLLARRAGASPSLAALISLLIAANPLYFNLSYTFMTDVSFTALVLLSLLALDLAITRDSWAWLFTGLVLAIAATLCRQLGLMIALGFAATLILQRPTSVRNWSIAIAFAALNVAAYLVVPYLLYQNLRGSIESDAYFARQLVAKQSVTIQSAKVAARDLIYLGLFLAPLALMLLRSYFHNARRALLIVAAAISVIATAALFALRLRLPGYNTISSFSLGPLVSHGTEQLPHVPKIAWWVLSGVGTAAVSVLIVGLLAYLWEHRRSFRTDRTLLVLLLSSAAAYSVPAVILGRADRYLLPLVPIAAVSAVYLLSGLRATHRPFAPLNAAFLVVLALVSAVATRDYRTRIGAHWSLATDLHRTGVDPDRIKAGFEFNAWHNFGDPRCRIWTKGPFVIDDEFLISYATEVDGYRLNEQRSYSRLLPPDVETVRLFERIATVPDTAPAPNHPRHPSSSAKP